MAKKVQYAGATPWADVPERVPVIALYRPSPKAKTYAKQLVEVQGGKVWALCRKFDGSLRLLGEFRFEPKLWLEERTVGSSYLDKEGRCPACAGCSKPAGKVT